MDHVLSGKPKLPVLGALTLAVGVLALVPGCWQLRCAVPAAAINAALAAAAAAAALGFVLTLRQDAWLVSGLLLCHGLAFQALNVAAADNAAGWLLLDIHFGLVLAAAPVAASATCWKRLLCLGALSVPLLRIGRPFAAAAPAASILHAALLGTAVLLLAVPALKIFRSRSCRLPARLLLLPVLPKLGALSLPLILGPVPTSFAGMRLLEAGGYGLMLAGFSTWLLAQTWTAGRRLAALAPWPERLRTLADGFPFPLFYADSHREIRWHNRFFGEWFSRGGGGIAGRHLRDVLGEAAYLHLWSASDRALHGEAAHTALALPSAADGARAVDAYLMSDRRGAPAHGCLGALLPGREPESRPAENTATVYELTVQRYLSEVEESRMRIEQQAEMLRSQSEELVVARDQALAATQAKSAFLANMSHELRTPLNGIVTMANLLCEESLSPSQLEYAEIVKTSSDALLTIINDILDFSKIEAGKLAIAPHPFSLRDTVLRLTALLEPMMDAKDIVFVQEIDTAVPDALIGDAGRIRQVMINLISNAIKFTPQHGAVILYLHPRSLSDQSAEIQINVCDTGIGIAPDKQEKIFGAFDQEDASTTRHHGGTGLGLSISRRLTELMGGRLWLQSRKQIGSAFSFSLHLERQACTDDQAAAAKAAPQPAAGSALIPLSILVAEDNQMSQRVISRLLELLGHKAHIAKNGAEAVAALGREHFDLVLMDCHMPEMDGYEATRTIRRHEAARGGHVPIIGLTAATLQQELDQCLTCGMDEYITKPVPKDILQEKLQYYARRGCTAAASAPERSEEARG